ncbi:MAG: hypothetical protein IT324_01995 [Anaerolineae bacterium]|nr:hypothetical protein [Anaerolineae bacterium]
MKAQTQSDPVIVLDNATPSADITITPTNGATGAIYAELDSAALNLRDSAHNIVLSLSDPRVTAIGIRLAQHAAPHILHLERLPGLAMAQVKVTAQKALPEVTLNAPVTVAESNTLNSPAQIKALVAQTHTIPLTASASANLLTVQFAPQDTTFQLIASDTGVALTGIAGKQISGVSLRLSPGQYTLNLMNRDSAAKADVTVSLSPAPALTMARVVPTATAPAIAAVVTATSQPTQAAQLCTATVNETNVALYSGPGTAYTTLGYATRGNVFAAGGVNREHGWLLVQSQIGGAWISEQAVMVAGDCNNLPVYDTPVQNASDQPTTTVHSGQQPGDHSESHDHGEEHDNDEHDEHDD